MTLRTLCFASTVGALAFFGAPASAQLTNTNIVPIPIDVGDVFNQGPPAWKCARGDGSACTRQDLANRAQRQILVMPTGYADTPEDRAAFWIDFDTVVAQLSNTGKVWSTQKKTQLLYVGYFASGATFGGSVAPHPVRGYALTLSQDAVYAQVDALRGTLLPELLPMAVGVVFNDFQTGITANATPPSFSKRPYGIAKMNREQLKGGYVAAHELAHAALNFLDEYVEPGFEDLNVHLLDTATPFLSFDGAISDRFGVYDYNVSEILAANGNNNIALSSSPSTVTSPGRERYLKEGGLFFGHGTFHEAGNNLMSSNQVPHGPDNDFAYAHSPSQNMVIESAFGAGPYRANDRLRNAGPRNGWPAALGSATTVMLYDGDKNHSFQPTQSYAVQAGWYERTWRTCWAGPFPYPCYTDVWRVAEKKVTPQRRTVGLPAANLYGLTNTMQSVLCGTGMTEVAMANAAPFKLCEQPLDQVGSGFLPTFTFQTPYQDTDVPANQWFTTYWWRFSSNNGVWSSGFTGWSSFYRSL
jgi:hypothetical protein